MKGGWREEEELVKERVRRSVNPIPNPDPNPNKLRRCRKGLDPGDLEKNTHTWPLTWS